MGNSMTYTYKSSKADFAKNIDKIIKNINLDDLINDILKISSVDDSKYNPKNGGNMGCCLIDAYGIDENMLMQFESKLNTFNSIDFKSNNSKINEFYELIKSIYAEFSNSRPCGVLNMMLNSSGQCMDIDMAIILYIIASNVKCDKTLLQIISLFVKEEISYEYLFKYAHMINKAKELYPDKALYKCLASGQAIDQLIFLNIKDYFDNNIIIEKINTNPQSDYGISISFENNNGRKIVIWANDNFQLSVSTI